MKQLISRFAVFAAVFALPTGVFASASFVSDVLAVKGNADVSRAAFLKAAVIVLGVPVDMRSPPKQYRAYPDDMMPYVRAADELGALDAFGADPDVSKPITRGEALRLVAELRAWTATGAVPSFRDVDVSTDLAAAVRIATLRGWMSPLRPGVFGVHAVLRGKEARAFLLRAADDVDEKPADVVRSTKRRETIGFQSKKFRDQIHTLLRTEYLYGDRLLTATGATAKELVENIHDPYTSLFDPVEAKEFRAVLSGTVTGIGVHLDAEHYDVISVVEGSPAEKAGILAGDRIVSVNKKRVEGLKFDQVINAIRGRAGTPVRIGVRRAGDDESFDIVRAAIEIPDTSLERRSGVAIVKITQFGDHLIKDAAVLFDGLAAEDLDGIVIDMRSNPGGYLQAVPSVLNEFLPNNSVFLYTRGRNFIDDYETTDEPSIAEDVPLVVLVDEGTASAAEIVAGALQDYGRATIVGKKTYGKGTVQTVVPFPNKASLKYTIAEWLTPDRHPIDKIGIMPDVEVDQSDAGDAQLEKALEIIRGMSS